MKILLFVILFYSLHIIKAWHLETKLAWSRASPIAPISKSDQSSGVHHRSAITQTRQNIGHSKTKRSQKFSKVNLLRLHDEMEKASYSSSSSSSTTTRIQHFTLQVDPWGVDKEQSHLSLPSWAFTDSTEQRHLAAMKVVLGRDLEKLEEKTITKSDGQIVKVRDAFPDVYGDFRLLRFLRKDTVQDPVTAAVRYRQFLQWREDNHVDEIRMEIEEKLERGEPDAFLPPTNLQIVNKYLPCTIRPLKSCNGMVPIVLHVGEWDTQGITKLIQRKELSMENFLAYWIYMYEALNLHLYQESLRTRRIVSIEELFDLSGLTLSHFSHGFVSHVLKPWIDMTQSNYPETTKSIIFLRPTRVFSLVWKILSPLFSKGTVAKVSMEPNFDISNLEFCPSEMVEQQSSNLFQQTTISRGLGAVLI